MQQDPNLQVPFNPNVQQGAYPYPPNSQGGYPQQPMYPQFNNTYNNNGGFQQNPPPGYNPAYNPPGYQQQPYGAAPTTQVIVDNTQMQVMTAQNSAYSIESRIITGFCCYTCLVYFELICSIGNLIWGIVIESELDVGGYIALYVCSAVCMFIACIVALVAKANFDRAKQYASFVLFMIATCLMLASNIVLIVNISDQLSDYSDCYYDYYGNWECGSDNYYDYDDLTDAILTTYQIAAITGLVIQFLINLTLIICSYSLVGLLRRREQFLQEAQRKANNGTAAVVITA